jgi:hypothetical protein
MEPMTSRLIPWTAAHLAGFAPPTAVRQWYLTFEQSRPMVEMNGRSTAREGNQARTRSPGGGRLVLVMSLG